MKQLHENILYIVVGLGVLGLVYSKFIEFPELFVILLTFVGFASFLNGITEFINMVIRHRKDGKFGYLKNSFKK